MTDKEIESFMNRSAWKRFEESGDIEKVTRLMVHGYALTTMGNYCIEEANEVMRGHGIMQYGLKQTAGEFSRAFDRHCRIMQSFFPDIPAKLAFCKAVDGIREQIDRMMESDELIEREESADRTKETAQK